MKSYYNLYQNENINRLESKSTPIKKKKKNTDIFLFITNEIELSDDI